MQWKQLVDSKQTWRRRWATEHEYCSLQISMWCDVSQHAQCKFETRMRASWMVVRSNTRSLRSFLIHSSPRTDEGLSYCTNTRTIPSQFSTRVQLQHSKSVDDGHTKSLYSPIVPIFFTQMQSIFLQSCAKMFFRFFCDCIVNLLKGNLRSMKRHQVTNIQLEVPIFTSKRRTWNERRDLLGSKKRLQIKK